MYFTTFVLLVDTSSDCHLAYEPLGTAAPLDTLHYVQPRRPPSLYPSKLSTNSVAQTPALIEDDSTQGGYLDLALVTAQLNSLTEAIKTLSSPTPSPALPANSPSPFNPPSTGVLLSTILQCLGMRFFVFFIMTQFLFLRFALATPPTTPTLKLIGLPRNSTAFGLSKIQELQADFAGQP